MVQVRIADDGDDPVPFDARQVLETALHAYAALTPGGRIVAWNAAAQALFGYTAPEAYGRDFADLLVAARSRPQYRLLLEECAAETDTCDGRRMQMGALHSDGRELLVDMALTATGESDRRLVHTFISDVTHAQRISRFAATEAVVSRGLAAAESSNIAAASVVDALAERMGWSVAELWLADDKRRTIVCAARHAPTGLPLTAFGVHELQPGVGLPGRVFEQAAPDWIPDLAADITSFRSRAGARIGLHVAVGVPVCSGGRTLGALCVYGDRIEDPEDTLIALLSSIAAQVGQYLERRRAEELAVELAKTKDEFLALVTHELRNPLSIITSAASLLDDDLETTPVEHQRRQLATICRNAQRLTIIADDLLELARLEAGQITIHPCETDLSTILGETLAAYLPQATQKSLTVTAELPERLALVADPHRLRQVADNLLSNAIKYTPSGGTVTVTATADPTAGSAVWAVADTGIGIPAAERPLLFRRFYRASTARQHRIPGTGLGLVISRTIIECHHGQLTLDDTAGPGATFIVTLPLQLAAPSHGRRG